MQKKLSDICDIISGHTFRDSIENDTNGEIVVLQAKNILVNQDIINTSDLIKVSDKQIRNPYFLEHNDILIVSRGSGLGSFRSALFATDQHNIMPSSSVHVIHINDVSVLPKYISLYLNSEIGQKSLLQIVTGASYIQSILIKNLMNFKIPIPPIHIQKLVVSLHENFYEQERVIRRKLEIQKTIINASFIKLNTQ